MCLNHVLLKYYHLLEVIFFLSEKKLSDCRSDECTNNNNNKNDNNNNNNNKNQPANPLLLTVLTCLFTLPIRND